MTDVVGTRLRVGDQIAILDATDARIRRHHSLAKPSNIVCIMHVESRPDGIMRRIVRARKPALGVWVISFVASSQCFRVFR